MANVTFEYKPLPIFLPFHSSSERTRLIIGGYGSGKSHALCAEAIALGLEQPGSEFLVMRKTVPALKVTTEKIFVSLMPPEFMDQCHVTKAGGHLDTVVFPNGSTYYFRGCDDWKKHRSMNLAYIVWDEADEFTPDDFDGLQSRIRQTKPTPQARQLGYTSIDRRGNVLACNPQGHNWIWSYGVNADTRKDGWAFWRSTSFDNPYLPADTLEDWLRMPDPWVRRYVLASFDEFAGAIYPDWAYDTHVIQPFKDSAGRYRYDPASWFRMGFDPGTDSLNAAVWCYYDKAKHTLVGVAEYAEGGLNVTQHANAWRRIEATHGMQVRERLADPKAVNHRDRGSNMKLADQYRRKGFPFALGPGGVDDRVWTLGELIANGRFKVTTECPRLYEQILNYRWEDLTPAQMEKGREAKPLKKDVDLVDAAQYAVSRYVPPPKVRATPVDPVQRETIEIHRTIRRQLDRNRRKNAQSSNELGMIL